jgi:hypothetical protein
LADVGLDGHVRHDGRPADLAGDRRGGVADVVVAGLRDERSLLRPHPEVADYERRRADDRDRWLGGMRKLLRRISSM